MSCNILLIAYSGHAYVVLTALHSRGITPKYYLDREEKTANPYLLTYLGDENSPAGRRALAEHDHFVAVGDNHLRARLAGELPGRLAAAIVHAGAIVDPLAEIGAGALVGPGAVVNPLAEVGRGAIVNSRAVVEHECRVGAFAHVAPGATLLGNVTVGERTLIGANAVVLPGVTVGADCIIGAGSVVRHDVPAGTTVAGNPARKLPHRP